MDIENPTELTAWLRNTGRVGAAETPLITVLQGGVSNRTVLVERPCGESWVLKQALAKLRVEADWFSPPERIQREAAGMRWLGSLLPAGAVPALIFQDFPLHLLAMEALPDRTSWKTRLLAGCIEAPHFQQFGRILAAVHRGGWERRDEAALAFADRSFFESLRLEPYYEYTAARIPAAAAFLHRVVQENRDTRMTIVHGDFSPKNILLRNGNLVLLDHEVIHFGDPAFDLGFSLTHLLAKAHHLAARRSDFAAAANLYWTSYRQALGPAAWAGNLEPRAVRNTLACLLARVAGRSPLEYLSQPQRRRQAEAVLALLPQPPASIETLIGAFLERLD